MAQNCAVVLQAKFIVLSCIAPHLSQVFSLQIVISSQIDSSPSDMRNGFCQTAKGFLDV